MTVPASLRQHGWTLVDNGSPCITEGQARALDLPLDYARRSVVEMDLLHCKHCGGTQIKNPDRVRPRNSCMKCAEFGVAAYVCDPCALRMTFPDYVHETFWGKVDRLAKLRQKLVCV